MLLHELIVRENVRHFRKGTGVSKCWGRNAQVCAGSCTWTSLSSSQMVPSHAQLSPELSFLPGLGASRAQPVFPLNNCWPFPPFPLHFFAVTKVELRGPYPSKDWPLITTRGQKIKRINFRNSLCLGPLFSIFWVSYSKLVEILVGSFISEGDDHQLSPPHPLLAKIMWTFAPMKALLLSLQPKQNGFHGGDLLFQRPSRPGLFRRHSFLWWGNVFHLCCYGSFQPHVTIEHLKCG